MYGISPIKPSEFQILLSVESYDRKNLLKITEMAKMLNSALFQNYQRYRSQTLIEQIEDLGQDDDFHVGIFNTFQ